MQQWHEGYWGNQPLSDVIEGLFRRRDFQASIINLGLRPRALVGELTVVVLLNGSAVKLPSKYLTFIPLSSCSSQLRSEKLVFAWVLVDAES